MGGRALSTFELIYRTMLPAGTDDVIAPGGMATQYGSTTGFQLEGGTASQIQEASTDQTAYRIAPAGGALTLTWRCDGAVTAPYPQAMFTPRNTQFTRSAADLVAEAQDDAGDLLGVARARAIACATAERFTYGHPTARFNDGFDHVPALGCGLTEGSWGDINTYFIAALRAVGIAAGYVTGFFFPEDKGNHCEDGHCWVVTRINGETQEWDIAHHLKMGTRDIQPGLNPKPGRRAASFHSMGLAFPVLGLSNVKALIEPIARMDEGYQPFPSPDICLSSTSKASEVEMQGSAV